MGAADLERVLAANISSSPVDLHHAFNANQIASKTWLLDRLHDSLGGHFETVYILGGWYGVLGAMILGDARFAIGRVISFDIDPGCAPVAERINGEEAARARFQAVTADARGVRYDPCGAGGVPNLVINTSCEHMTRTADWYGRIPDGMAQEHQSNDYFDCPEHVNCIASLEAFKDELPMSDLRYEGTLPRRRYSRFMLIGKK